jgi:type II secretory pathway pseudopilin PulG
VEVLVVMIIIGILAAISIPLFLNQQRKGHETAAKSDAVNIGQEVATFLVDSDVSAVNAGTLPISGPAVVALTATKGATSETVPVKLSAGDTLTKLTFTPTADTYCVEITPSGAAGGTWSAAPGGAVKGTCP